MLSCLYGQYLFASFVDYLLVELDLTGGFWFVYFVCIVALIALLLFTCFKCWCSWRPFVFVFV